jgi:hypothetical protein
MIITLSSLDLHQLMILLAKCAFSRGHPSLGQKVLRFAPAHHILEITNRYTEEPFCRVS